MVTCDRQNPDTTSPPFFPEPESLVEDMNTWRGAIQIRRRTGSFGWGVEFRTTIGALSVKSHLLGGCFLWIPGPVLSTQISRTPSSGSEPMNLDLHLSMKPVNVGRLLVSSRGSPMCSKMRFWTSGVVIFLSCSRSVLEYWFVFVIAFCLWPLTTWQKRRFFFLDYALRFDLEFSNVGRIVSLYFGSECLNLIPITWALGFYDKFRCSRLGRLYKYRLTQIKNWQRLCMSCSQISIKMAITSLKWPWHLQSSRPRMDLLVSG